MKVWERLPPSSCNLCGDLITNQFVDAQLFSLRGLWASMCLKCYRKENADHNIGRAEVYTIHREAGPLHNRFVCRSTE